MVVWLAATNYFLQVEKGLFFSFLFWKILPGEVCFSINLFALFQYLLSAATGNQFVLFKHNIECKITIFRFKSKAIFSLFCQYTNGLMGTVSENAKHLRFYLRLISQLSSSAEKAGAIISKVWVHNCKPQQYYWEEKAKIGCDV